MTEAPLHIVLLELADRSLVGEHRDGHNTWIDEGINDDVFLLTGTVPDRGGAVLARNLTRDELAARLELDPFVANGVVTAEIIEVAPSRLHPDLVPALTI